jgi:hypothetical protein
MKNASRVCAGVLVQAPLLAAAQADFPTKDRRGGNEELDEYP